MSREKTDCSGLASGVAVKQSNPAKRIPVERMNPSRTRTFNQRD
jgi:hypothetical protein